MNPDKIREIENKFAQDARRRWYALPFDAAIVQIINERAVLLAALVTLNDAHPDPTVTQIIENCRT
jgi:hypothetical protein